MKCIHIKKKHLKHKSLVDHSEKAYHKHMEEELVCFLSSEIFVKLISTIN